MGEHRYWAVHDYSGGRRFSSFESKQDRDTFIKSHTGWRQPNRLDRANRGDMSRRNDSVKYT